MTTSHKKPVQHLANKRRVAELLLVVAFTLFVAATVLEHVSSAWWGRALVAFRRQRWWVASLGFPYSA